MDAPLAGSSGDSSVCQSISQEADALPVDLYIMMDRSISMNEPAGDTGLTRWEAIRDAVEAFVTSPDAGDIGAGIGFFGKTQNGDDAIDCNPDNYAEPEVEIGLLSEVGEDILAAIDDIDPGGVTPTLPALEGALAHAQDWARDNPDRASMVVLVTDGYPRSVRLAASPRLQKWRASQPRRSSVRTYVIGLDGTQNLEGIARAGGSKAAFLVESADIAEEVRRRAAQHQLRAARLQLRGAGFPGSRPRNRPRARSGGVHARELGRPGRGAEGRELRRLRPPAQRRLVLQRSRGEQHTHQRLPVHLLALRSRPGRRAIGVSADHRAQGEAGCGGRVRPRDCGPRPAPPASPVLFLEALPAPIEIVVPGR